MIETHNRSFLENTKALDSMKKVSQWNGMNSTNRTLMSLSCVISQYCQSRLLSCSQNSSMSDLMLWLSTCEPDLVYTPPDTKTLASSDTVVGYQIIPHSVQVDQVCKCSKSQNLCIATFFPSLCIQCSISHSLQKNPPSCENLTTWQMTIPISIPSHQIAVNLTNFEDCAKQLLVVSFRSNATMVGLQVGEGQCKVVRSSNVSFVSKIL